MTATSLPASSVRMPPAAAAKRRDVRRVAVTVVVLLIIVLGSVVQILPGKTSESVSAIDHSSRTVFDGLVPSRPVGTESEGAPGETSGPDHGPAREVRELLRQAAAHNEARRHDAAIATLNRLRPLDPNNAEAYMRVGDALLGKKDYVAARDFYLAAVDRNPVLSGAYFGFAVASEALGDLESAIGGMRNYLHVEPDKAPGRLPVAQARSAIWEWESKLGRGPWGPTKGVPPGWTADEIKRDGRGVGVKMQKIETLRPDGTMDYEIKAGDRFPELWRK